ncbi:Ceramide synthase 3 [Phlyctochytrium planicorne]|nr:Ceramide synthase 3 [Phlyctochytrium planicorne]
MVVNATTSAPQSHGILNASLQFPSDIYLLAFWTIVWGLAHTTFRSFVKPLARKYAIDPQPPVKKDQGPPRKVYNLRQRKPSQLPPPEPEKKKPAKNAVKLATSAWKFTNYGLMVLLGTYVLWNEDWVFTPKQYFQGWPESHDMSEMIKFYYQVSFGSCAYMLVSIFLEPIQKDFVAMFLHHVFTLTLVTASYFLAFHRIGAVILLLHDLADPVMEVAKMYIYTGNQKMADTFFALFALVFIFTRNFIYPVYVISSIPLYAFHSDGRYIPYGNAYIYFFCLGCLGVLCSIQFYWGSLIVKMAVKAVVEKKVDGDIRDEDE